ncbi:hypothetical protein K437DRAFT_219198 [Tilletiaria anomala UBC 951]|uniref:DUF1168-domain-containing protein n=1 Tax=Tilletiaria anomala (strain ATCC 24038 / CBS 436.72 / UBC 951) TaxID=1037660 RepID=A0A066WQE1_TILAU|nr:uncharacterized protein K437DRAFT_219198 [Tilletiaria anomala UBC 951]KDN53229.1 hypothetical protein K437DRAFT_219198 [Tilletiaria anomala UBC 951]
MTAAEKQAANLQKLMANPEKEVKIPTASTTEKQLRPPKEMMKNVSGSSAGAGSGEFHVYKHARRREYERIKIMETEDQKKKEKFVFEQAQAAREAELKSKTSKNKSRRDKRKVAKQRAKVGADGAPGAQSAVSDNKRKLDGIDEGADGDKKRKVAPGADALTYSRPDAESDSEAE